MNHARDANGAAGSKGSVEGGLEGFGHAVVLVGARGALVHFGQPLSIQSTVLSINSTKTVLPRENSSRRTYLKKKRSWPILADEG